MLMSYIFKQSNQINKDGKGEKAKTESQLKKKTQLYFKWTTKLPSGGPREGELIQGMENAVLIYTPSVFRDVGGGEDCQQIRNYF